MTAAPQVGIQLEAYVERMQVSLRQVAAALGRFANEIARAFAVPIHLVAPEWETRVDKARRLRVDRAMRTYRRRAARRAARERRHAVLRSAHA